MDNTKTPYHRNRRPVDPEDRKRIDFSTLSKFELDQLSQKWEKAARDFEAGLSSYMANPNANDEKIERLWDVGVKLWRRLRTLERWRTTRGMNDVMRVHVPKI